jgi:hydrogenase maturation protein HypF
MDRNQQQHLQLQLSGLVQGVGFRPHVVRLAKRHGLHGSVGNNSSGVALELEGPRSALEAFTAELLSHPPAQARIDRQQLHWSAARGCAEGMQILPPAPGGSSHAGHTALVSPDLAICSRCLAELADPSNRRHGYPFISCCDCGPRYTLLEQLPFEREHTSLRHFPLCSTCRSEYGNPEDRRFHAQTISCPACGPQLLWNGAVRPAGAAIDAAAAALQRGAVVALQGVGGFQLLVNPADAAAVQRLRQRKGRPDKPLALLTSQAWLQANAQLTAAEWKLWHSAAAPIVLVRGGAPWLGVMRACSGLQQLLLERCGGVVVATSANRSGEPLCADPHVDAAVLQQLADAVLSHSLPIVNRIDDSVMRWAAGAPLVLRLGRGLAPLAQVIEPDRHPSAEQPDAVLALGAQLKGSVGLQLPGQRLLSPDLGDLSSSAGARHQQHTASTWLERQGVQLQQLACDQHPAYSSSQLAEAIAAREALPLLKVQHHHAHLLAVMAEHQLQGKALGVAWDGAGQGDDDTLWGGEALEVQANGYQRIAMLRPFPLPGGEMAQREPRRVLLGLLVEAHGGQWREALAGLPDLPWLRAFAADDLALLERSLQRGINSPRCSSIGRLFDAVAALLNLAQRCSYEAQAATALEGLALQALERDELPRCLLKLPLEPSQGAAPLQWNWQPLLEQLLAALAQGNPASAIALGFHQALADAIAALAAARQAPQLLLAGGCFQNALLLERSVAALARQGCHALWPQQLPCNDAALPIGQLLAAETMSINRIAPQAARDVPGRCR